MNDSSARVALRRAAKLALNSLDQSSQNGAFIAYRDGRPVLSDGGEPLEAWNAFPTGVVGNDHRWERPQKYAYVEHAERAAIFRAARSGTRTRGLSLVCTWAACADCARAIILAGITELVTLARRETVNESGRWNDSVEVGDEMLAEAGVRVQYVTGPLSPAQIAVRMNGTLVVL